MITVIQRVRHARITVDGHVIAAIELGLLALIGIEKADHMQQAQRLLDRILSYRIFADDNDQMNHNLVDLKAELLLVPQFTLVADTKKGCRPSFSSAATPASAKALFESLVEYAKSKYDKIQSGQFGADMQIDLCNIGPVTFILEKK